MAKLKTQKNDASVETFLNSVLDEKKRQDSFVLLDLVREITGDEPARCGDSIVGFGSYRYKCASGRENEWFQVEFSLRKQNLTPYIISGFSEYDALLTDISKHKTGKSCLCVKKPEDVDLAVLRELVKLSVAHVAAASVAGDESSGNG